MKRFLFASIVIIAIFFIAHSLQSIYELWKKQDILIAEQKLLQKEEDKHKKLEKQLSIVSDPAFVIEEARNKLFLIKPGERTVFIAKGLIATKSAETVQVIDEPNWEKWIKIFF